MALGDNIKKDQLIPGQENAGTSAHLNNQYAQILEDCAEVVIMADAKGSVQFFNASAEKLFGYQRQEVLGKNVKMLMGEPYHSEHDQYLSNYQSTRQAKVIGIGREVEGTSKSGEKIPILLTLTESKIGEQYIYTAFIRDLRHQKKLETENRQRLEELQASEEELRQNMEELSATQEVMQRKEIELQGQIDAIDQTMGWIEFDPEGYITYINDNMLGILGYHRQEVLHQHHGIFTKEDYRKSEEYKHFWQNLNAGKSFKGEVLRLNKQQEEIWLQVTYTPVRNREGKVVKILKLALDITESKNKSIDFESQLKAVDESNARVELSPDGTLLKANSHFLEMMGYGEGELLGKHHRMLVNPSQWNSESYHKFWEELRSGNFQAGEFTRLHKNGSEVYIRGSYNPIRDSNGKIYKIVKFAQDVSEQKRLEKEIAAQLEDSRAKEEEIRQNMEELQATQEKQAKLTEQLAQSQAETEAQLSAINLAYGFVEFDPEGKVLNANDVFLNDLQYDLSQVQGKHHRIFVPSHFVSSHEYQKFWQDLRQGIARPGVYERIDRHNQTVWLDAVYTPVFDQDGKVTKVIKLARNVTDFRVSLNAVSLFLEQIGKGNFEAELDLQGRKLSQDLDSLVQDNLKLRDTLRNIIKEVNRVVGLAGLEGNLKERMHIEDQQGTWAELTESVNTLLEAIYNPIMAIKHLVIKIAEGDLSEELQIEMKGELRQMGDALNQTIHSLNNILHSIEESAQTVAEASAQMMQKAVSIQQSTQEASSAIQEMADGAREQATRTDESSRLVEETLRAASNVSEKSEIITQSADKGQQSTHKGLESIQTLVQNMGNIISSADASANSIEVLTKRSEEISRILSVINEIAFQTKLLSVNANIEAARAGESGRGFQVVAEEIGKLAEDSRRSTVEIEQLIKDVQRDIQTTQRSIEEMKQNVVSGKSATQNAEEVFQEINLSNRETLVHAKDILQASKQQKEAIGVLVQNIEKIVIVSEETASGTQEVANSSREMNKTMAEVAHTSESLAQIAQDLTAKVAKFKLKNR